MKIISLLYHDVVVSGNFSTSGFTGKDAEIYKLDLDEFIRHLDALPADKEFSILSKKYDNKNTIHTLTFDDGGASASRFILDELEKRGIKAYFFITTDYIGTNGFTTEEDIRKLREKGHIVGTHTCSHPKRMSFCSSKQMDYEWKKSKHKLEDILLENVYTASVPGGYFSKKVAKAASAAGIQYLFTSEPVTKPYYVDGCMVLGRFSIKRGDSSVLPLSYLEENPWPRFKAYAFWNSKKVLKKLGGEKWLALRKKLLERKDLS